jgi:hypothetical protein
MERRSNRFGFRQLVSVGCVLLMAGMGSVAMAQAPAPPPAQSQTFAPQQLDNLVAPIALYPDPLLGQVLAATTYPVELVEAQQWLQANTNLHGIQLTDAARQQNWDASVAALVAMPDVLTKLNQDIHWTTDLGNAFLAQPADVMAAVQRLRARAQANGKLQSNQQETVTTETQGGQQAIDIQPADPQMVYVPVYDPTYVWGAPEWGAYPGLYYPYYGFGWYPGIRMGLFFGGWGGWGWGGWGWGWGPNWFGGGLFVNGGFFNRYGYAGGFGAYGAGFRGNAAWAHNPAHRMGAAYSTAGLNSRYGAASQASRIASARSGNYHSFGTAGTANRGATGNVGSSYRGGATAQSAAGRTGTQGAGGYQHFQAGRQSYQAPAGRSYGSAGSQQRSAAPSAGRSYGSAGGQHYSAPSSHYSAPSSGGRSYGGGSVGHSSGGGHASGGGGHGGGRR